MKGTGKIKLAAAAAIPVPSSPAPSPLEAEPLFGVLRDGVRRTKVVESGRCPIMRKLLILPRSTESGARIAEKYERLREERHRRHVEHLIEDLIAVEVSCQANERRKGPQPEGVPREPQQTPDGKADNGGA